MRGHKESCPVVLSSATPSLETLQNIHEGKYAHLLLPERYGTAEMAKISLIDMSKQIKRKLRWISPILQREIKKL